MMGMNNFGEAKSDWGDDTQLMITMVDSDEVDENDILGMSNHGIALNNFGGTDQHMQSGRGQNVIMGMNLPSYGSNTYRSDVLLAQNSDISMIPSISDTRFTYTMPVTDESKCSVIWETESYEKQSPPEDMVSVIQSTSRAWNEMERSNDSMSDFDAINDQENKYNSGYFSDISSASQSNSVKDDTEDCLVGYYRDTVMVPTSCMLLKEKTTACVHSEEETDNENYTLHNSKNQTYINEGASTSKLVKSDISFAEGTNNENKSLILNKGGINKLTATQIPLIDLASDDSMGAGSSFDNYNERNFAASTSQERANDFGLPEECLPPKKKPRMMTSPVPGTASQSPMDETEPSEIENILKNLRSRFPNVTATVERDENECDTNQSDSDESLPPNETIEYTPYSFRRKMELLNDDRSLDDYYYQMIRRKIQKAEEFRQFLSCATTSQILDYLKNIDFMQEDLCTALRNGLEDMEVEMIKEMYTKRNHVNNEHSSQLKSFALMIYFQRPSAYKRLCEVFRGGWPSVKVLKDWDKGLNLSQLDTKTVDTQT